MTERGMQNPDSMSMPAARPLPNGIAKVFCIGRNKTGTKSLSGFFRINGFSVGNQEQAEQMMTDWVRRDFKRIIAYCDSAQVFQDVPFSLDFTYQAVDQAFPGSRFILSVRRNALEWYRSITEHHSRRFSATRRLPTADELRDFRYRDKYPGWLLFMQEVVYGYPATPLYDKRLYMAHYERHNAGVLEYFKFRQDELLVLNLSEQDASTRLCRFVGLDPAVAAPLPHLNKSRDM